MWQTCVSVFIGAVLGAFLSGAMISCGGSSATADDEAPADGEPDTLKDEIIAAIQEMYPQLENPYIFPKYKEGLQVVRQDNTTIRIRSGAIAERVILPVGSAQGSLSGRLLMVVPDTIDIDLSGATQGAGGVTFGHNGGNPLADGIYYVFIGTPETSGITDDVSGYVSTKFPGFGGGIPAPLVRAAALYFAVTIEDGIIQPMHQQGETEVLQMYRFVANGDSTYTRRFPVSEITLDTVTQEVLAFGTPVPWISTGGTTKDYYFGHVLPISHQLMVLNIEARGEGEVYMGVSDVTTVQEKVAVVSGTNVVTQRMMSPRSFSSGRLIKIRTTGTAEVQVRLVGSFPQAPQ